MPQSRIITRFSFPIFFSTVSILKFAFLLVEQFVFSKAKLWRLLRGYRRVIVQFRMSPGIVGRHIVYIQNGAEQSDPIFNPARASLSLSLSWTRAVSRGSRSAPAECRSWLPFGIVLASGWDICGSPLAHSRPTASPRCSNSSCLVEAALVILLSRFFSDDQQMQALWLPPIIIPSFLRRIEVLFWETHLRCFSHVYASFNFDESKSFR